MTKRIEKYLKEKHKICSQLELVENFDLALQDEFKGWVLHHRLGEFITTKRLKENDLYENRPPEELKFVTHQEHVLVHNRTFISRMNDDEKKTFLKKISEAIKGTKRTAEQRKNYSAGAIKRWQDPEERKKQSERCKHTPEQREKISKAKVGRIWWTNGKDEKCQRELPGPNWVKGRFYGHS